MNPTLAGPTSNRLTIEDRVAILLTVLGDDVSENILTQFRPQRQAELRERLAECRVDPPSQTEIDEVIDEFGRVFRFAQRNLANQNPEREEGDGADEVTSPRLAETPDDEEEQIPLTGDPIVDINRLKPFQIYESLKDEHPRTIAVIIDSLNPELAAASLEPLPDDTRSDVLLQIKHVQSTPSGFRKRVIQSALQKALLVDASSTPTQDKDLQIAHVLRSMNKPKRDPIMKRLESEDPETAEQVRRSLYVFEDLMSVEVRSLQRVLAEIDSTTLATALKQADPELVERILSNMSKRARESLTEEMEFIGSPTPDNVKTAQETIADTIGRLDEAGEIVMTG